MNQEEIHKTEQETRRMIGTLSDDELNHMLERMRVLKDEIAIELTKRQVRNSIPEPNRKQGQRIDCGYSRAGQIMKEQFTHDALKGGAKE